MIKTTEYKYEPDYTIHPGEILAETLEARRMKKTDLAERCKLSPKTVSLIISGKAHLTPETAIQLEKVLGVSASIWSNLDTNYRLFKAKLAAREEFSKHKRWIAQFPIKQLISQGIIENKSNSVEMIEQLLKFFGVGSISVWQQRIKQWQVEFRSSPSFQNSPGSVAAWLRIGELRAQDIDCAPYNKFKFVKALRKIRQLTCEDPDAFGPKLKQLCADSGTALVFVPELHGTHVSGATRWIDKDKALIMLSLRHKTDDHFWFSFFHEVGHILHHSRKSIFLDEQKMELNEKEKRADEFAANMLIPNSIYNNFVAGKEYTGAAISAFAQRLGIAPGIVVGRLQHDKIIPFRSLNHLKRKFKLVERSE